MRDSMPNDHASKPSTSPESGSRAQHPRIPADELEQAKAVLSLLMGELEPVLGQELSLIEPVGTFRLEER